MAAIGDDEVARHDRRLATLQTKIAKRRPFESRLAASGNPDVRTATMTPQRGRQTFHWAIMRRNRCDGYWFD
jgi:hypothetical protein